MPYAWSAEKHAAAVRHGLAHEVMVSLGVGNDSLREARADRANR